MPADRLDHGAGGGLRAEPLNKPPGVAETIEWAEAATLLHDMGEEWPRAFLRAIGVVLKDEDDLVFLEPRIEQLISGAAA